MVPTKEQIFDYAQRLEEFYSQRNTNMLVWRELALLTKESYWVDSEGNYVPPEDYEVRIILPTAWNTIETYLALMLTRPPVITVPTSEVREVHKEQADMIEKMLYAVWSKSRLNSVLRDALWHSLVDGWGVLQVVYEPDADLKGRCPIYVKSIDPMGFYPMPSARPGEWEYVIIIQHRLVGDLRRSFILGKDGRLKAVKSAKQALEGYDDTDRVKILEYWDDTHHAFMVIPEETEQEEPDVALGEWLLPPTEHRFGRIPFAVFFGVGLPFRDRGERMGVGVLFPLEGLVRYSCQLISQKASIIHRYANPTLVTKTVEGRGFDIPSPIGGELPLELEESAEFLLPPGTPPDVDVQLNEIIAQIEQTGLPRHIMGQLAISRLSGIALSLLRTPVLMKVAFKQMSVEEALEDINEIILRTIENYVAEPIYLWGRDSEGQTIDIALDPTIINGYYRTNVKLTASLPTDETAVTAMVTALRQTDVLSSRTARDIIQQTLRDLTTQSLEDEENQILIEKLLALPQFQVALAMDAAREAGVELFMEAGPGRGNIPGSPMQGAIPGMPPGAVPPQQFPWRVSGRAEPTPAEALTRLINTIQGQQGGRPPRTVAAPTMASTAQSEVS